MFFSGRAETGSGRAGPGREISARVQLYIIVQPDSPTLTEPDECGRGTHISKT